jgi:hypothetical protein
VKDGCLKRVANVKGHLEAVYYYSIISCEEIPKLEFFYLEISNNPFRLLRIQILSCLVKLKYNNSRCPSLLSYTTASTIDLVTIENKVLQLK